MKNISKLSLLALLLGSLTALGQSFKSEEILTKYYESVNESRLEMHGTIRNTSSTDKKVLVKLVKEEFSPNHDTYFCWALCYSPAVKESPANDFITIKAGDTSKSFKSYIVINDSLGSGKLTYAFFDKDNPSDSVQVTFNYEIVNEVGIKSTLKNNSILSISPNPANGRTVINTVAGVDEISIFDISGKMVSRLTANAASTKHLVNTENLVQGIYLVRVKSKNNYSAPQKLFIVK